MKNQIEVYQVVSGACGEAAERDAEMLYDGQGEVTELLIDSAFQRARLFLSYEKAMAQAEKEIKDLFEEWNEAPIFSCDDEENEENPQNLKIKKLNEVGFRLTTKSGELVAEALVLTHKLNK